MDIYWTEDQIYRWRMRKLELSQRGEPDLHRGFHASMLEWSIRVQRPLPSVLCSCSVLHSSSVASCGCHSVEHTHVPVASPISTPTAGVVGNAAGFAATAGSQPVRGEEEG